MAGIEKDKVSVIFAKHYESKPYDLYLSDLLLQNPDITFKDLEDYYSPQLTSHPRSRFEAAVLVSYEIQAALYLLCREGHIRRSNNLKVGLTAFRERERVQIYPTRIMELQYFSHTLRVTAAEVLDNIPDLSINELMEEGKKALDPYGEAKDLYETQLFIKGQRDFVENFLREAVSNKKTRIRAIRLGKKLGIW